MPPTPSPHPACTRTSALLLPTSLSKIYIYFFITVNFIECKKALGQQCVIFGLHLQVAPEDAVVVKKLLAVMTMER